MDISNVKKQTKISKINNKSNDEATSESTLLNNNSYLSKKKIYIKKKVRDIKSFY